MHLKNKCYKKENKPILQTYILKTVKPLKFVGILVRHCLDISLCAVTSTGRTRAWVCKTCSSTKVQFDQLQRIWGDLLGECGTVEACRAPLSLSFLLLWWCPLLKCSLGGNWLLGLLSQAAPRAPHANYRCHKGQGAEFHTQAGQKSSLQHNCSCSCQTTAKEKWCKIRTCEFWHGSCAFC